MNNYSCHGRPAREDFATLSKTYVNAVENYTMPRNVNAVENYTTSSTCPNKDLHSATNWSGWTDACNDNNCKVAADKRDCPKYSKVGFTEPGLIKDNVKQCKGRSKTDCVQAVSFDKKKFKKNGIDPCKLMTSPSSNEVKFCYWVTTKKDVSDCFKSGSKTNEIKSKDYIKEGRQSVSIIPTAPNGTTPASRTYVWKDGKGCVEAWTPTTENYWLARSATTGANPNMQEDYKIPAALTDYTSGENFRNFSIVENHTYSGDCVDKCIGARKGPGGIKKKEGIDWTMYKKKLSCRKYSDYVYSDRKCYPCIGDKIQDKHKPGIINEYGECTLACINANNSGRICKKN